ncbi:MAG TPA: prenyltransferase/squalene oxidase repeat-containing protein [Iamia sp.]|jgi:hypothetical protein|nr:prenyltransferase/squalene oxidase repeat-containing protein [Iamia sp.]
MRLRTRLLTSAAVLGTLVVPLVPGAPVSAAPTPRSTPAIDDAVAWLETQQQADGGFEVGMFPGFETPDAILALASAGQTSEDWDTEEALAAVEAVHTDPVGAMPKDALDSVDDWVDSVQGSEATVGAKAQQAAKVIVLVAAPLGLDEADFDPSGDTEAAVDLLGAINAAQGDGSFPGVTSTGKAYVVWAFAALEITVPEGLLAAIAVGQQANGGFNFSGDPTGTGFDPDITAAVISALATAGKTTANDVTLRKAVVGLALQQRWNGEWAGEFDDGNANSTAVTVEAMAALGAPPELPCWRNAADTRLSGLPYPSPIEAILARQDDPTGRFTSPSDGFGVNTFATSQAIQGLAAAEGQWPYEGTGCTAVEASGNRRTVNALYIDLLVRLSDEAGAVYWTQQFDGGLKPALLAKRFTGTPEYAGRVVERLYQQYLGRSATPQERQLGADLVISGRRVTLVATLLGTNEYYDATAPTFPSGPPTTETWARAVYQSAMGRPASEADIDYVEAQLAADKARSFIARGLLRSAEGRGVQVRDIYRQLLRRNPSAADRAYWGGELARGVSPERLVTLIAGSAEYRASTQA